MSFVKELYKNPDNAEKKAQVYHGKNNDDPVLHLVAHGALCVVFLRKRQMFLACEQVYLGICAPFASVYRRYRTR